MSNAALLETPARAAPPAQLGPDSISWRINREIVTLLGWPAAVLTQLAHPHWLNGLPTISLLPPHTRRAYGFGWAPLQPATLEASGVLPRWLLPFIPPPPRHWRLSRLA